MKYFISILVVVFFVLIIVKKKRIVKFSFLAMHQ